MIFCEERTGQITVSTDNSDLLSHTNTNGLISYSERHIFQLCSVFCLSDIRVLKCTCMRQNNIQGDPTARLIMRSITASSTSTPGVHLSLREKHTRGPHNYTALTCRMHLNNLVPDNLDNSASCVKMANRMCVCVCASVSGAVNALIAEGDRRKSAVRNHSVINGTVTLADHCDDLQTLRNVFSLFYFNVLRLFGLS